MKRTWLNVLPLRSQYDRVKIENDGSVNLWFGLCKPLMRKTLFSRFHGQAQIIAIHRYGTGTEFNGQTWKPDEVIKLK